VLRHSQRNRVKTGAAGQIADFPLQFLILNSFCWGGEGEIPPLFFGRTLESHVFFPWLRNTAFYLSPPKVFLLSWDKRLLGLGRKALVGSGDSAGAGGRKAVLLFPSVSGTAASLLMQLTSCAGRRVVRRPLPPVPKEFIPANSIC